MRMKTMVGSGGIVGETGGGDDDQEENQASVRNSLDYKQGGKGH